MVGMKTSSPRVGHAFKLGCATAVLGALALAGCSSDEKTTTPSPEVSSAGQSSAAPSSAAPSEAASSASSAPASSAAASSAPASSGAPKQAKERTNDDLNATMKKHTSGGKAVAVPPTDQLKQQMSQTAQAKITPAACADASLGLAKAIVAGKPAAIGVSQEYRGSIVVDPGSVADAEALYGKIRDAFAKPECSSVTLSGNGVSQKVSIKVEKASVPGADEAFFAQATTDEGAGYQLFVRSGDLVMLSSDPQGADQASVSTDAEALVKLFG